MSRVLTAALAVLSSSGSSALAWAINAPMSIAMATASAVGASVVLGRAGWAASIEPRLRARRRIFFIGPPHQELDLEREVFLRPELALVGSAPVTEDPKAIQARIEELQPGVLLLSDDAMVDSSLVALAARFNHRGVRIRDLSSYYEQSFGKVVVGALTPAWFLFDIAEIHRARVYGTLARAIELTISLVLLFLSAPLFPLIALAIRLASPGPTFFRQTRVGRNGETFDLTKFRTMHSDPQREHGQWAQAGDSRLFGVGKVLRKFRFDELPQLWNVVRGDLSLVGPRPEQPTIVESLHHAMEFYGARHTIRPGLTGWAQINYGYGGSVDAALIKLQYDLYYVKHQSLALDLRIILGTIRTVLRGSGAPSTSTADRQEPAVHGRFGRQPDGHDVTDSRPVEMAHGERAWAA